MDKILEYIGSTALAAYFLVLGAVAFLSAILAMIAAGVWRSRAMAGIFMAGVLLGWLYGGVS